MAKAAARANNMKEKEWHTHQPTTDCFSSIVLFCKAVVVFGLILL